jgi:hypothetical protein
MGVIVVQDSPYGKECWKWEHREDETHPQDPTIRGMRPATKREYPMAMYQMTGKNPWTWEREQAADEVERRNLESRGFVAGGLGAAAEAFDALVQDAALAAAHRNYEDRSMSEKARAHSNAVEQASSRHLGEIPETPIRRRGRRPKEA